MITPLRKKKKDGVLYERPELILTQLDELEALGREQLLKRCAITSAKDTGYVHIECLLYFVRTSRSDNNDVWFERLYKLLIRRVLRKLPGGENAPQINKDIREKTVDRFVELLSTDRQDYDDRLDFYEVRFDLALASLRRSANRSSYREMNREEGIIDPESESGEISPEVEQAAVAFDPFAKGRLDQADYRFALEAAIDTLTPLQTRIITMLRLGYKIDSKETDEETISKTLGKSEKTIRTHRNKAYDALRAYLEPDAP